MDHNIKVIMGRTTNIKESESSYFKILAQYELGHIDFSELQTTVNSRGARLISRSDMVERSTKIYYPEGDILVDRDITGSELIAFEPRLLLEDLIKKRNCDAYSLYPPLIALLENMIYELSGDFQVVLFCQ